MKMYHLKQNAWLLCLLGLFFLFAGLECEQEEGRCEDRLSKTFTWLKADNSSFRGFQQPGKEMEFRFYPDDNYIWDICPTADVTVSARVKGKDGYFQPEPDYIRVWWESDLGWFEYKDYLQLPRTADNIWSGSANIGALARNFDHNTAANLEVWLKMTYVSVGDFHDNLNYIESEFTEFSISVEFTKF